MLAVAPAAAQTIRGPVLGYGWDETAARLRPILGIPGSALVGEGPEVGVELATAEVSPTQDFALALEAGSGAILELRLPAGEARPAPGSPGAARIFFSPAGAAAGLYYEDKRAVEILKGLPEAPVAGDRWEFDGPVTAAAISDQGQVLAATVDGSLLAGGRRIGSLGRASAMVFLPRSGDALVADQARSEILLLRDVFGAGERLVLAGEREGVERPMAVAGAGRRVLWVNAGSAIVNVLNLDGGPLERVPCTGVVAGLFPLRESGVFRLTAFSEEPLYLLEAAAGAPQILFVPAGRFGPRPPRQRARP